MALRCPVGLDNLWISCYCVLMQNMAALWPSLTSSVCESDRSPSPSKTRIYGLADCCKIQIKYGLPYCVTCPSMSMDPRSQTRVRGVAEYPGGGIPGSVRILGQVTQFRQNILNLYYSTGPWKLFWYPLTGILCQREAVSVAAKSWNLWSVVLHTTHYYYNYQYLCIQWH